MPGLRIVAPPQLSLLAFRLERPGATVSQADADTRALLQSVNARQRVMLSGCTVGERYLARICVLSFRTRAAHVDAAVEDVAAEAGVLAGTRS
ncbi:MAG: hypothetical protein FJ296_10670 [Planctomycetes bacterium]|nr:hypothetical protein [Planctomycetota bacterium]